MTLIFFPVTTTATHFPCVIHGTTTACVVYFNQQTHMVENDRKHKKMMKKVSFPSCVREAHVRRMKKNEHIKHMTYDKLPKLFCSVADLPDSN